MSYYSDRAAKLFDDWAPVPEKLVPSRYVGYIKTTKPYVDLDGRMTYDMYKTNKAQSYPKDVEKEALRLQRMRMDKQQEILDGVSAVADVAEELENLGGPLYPDARPDLADNLKRTLKRIATTDLESLKAGIEREKAMAEDEPSQYLETLLYQGEEWNGAEYKSTVFDAANINLGGRPAKLKDLRGLEDRTYVKTVPVPKWAIANYCQRLGVNERTLMREYRLTEGVPYAEQLVRTSDTKSGPMPEEPPTPTGILPLHEDYDDVEGAGEDIFSDDGGDY